MEPYEIVIPYLEEGIIAILPYPDKNNHLRTQVYTKKGRRPFSGTPWNFLEKVFSCYGIDLSQQKTFLKKRGRNTPLPLLTPDYAFYPLLLFQKGRAHWGFLGETLP